MRLASLYPSTIRAVFGDAQGNRSHALPANDLAGVDSIDRSFDELRRDRQRHDARLRAVFAGARRSSSLDRRRRGNRDRLRRAPRLRDRRPAHSQGWPCTAFFLLDGACHSLGPADRARCQPDPLGGRARHLRLLRQHELHHRPKLAQPRRLQRLARQSDVGLLHDLCHRAGCRRVAVRPNPRGGQSGAARDDLLHGACDPADRPYPPAQPAAAAKRQRRYPHGLAQFAGRL